MPMESVPNKLIVLWVTQDKQAAMNMAFMYARNSKVRGWWDQVELVIWGPSATLVLEDGDIQQELKLLQSVGVTVKACKACTNRYGITEELMAFGIEVVSMGLPLTEDLKNGVRVLTV